MWISFLTISSFVTLRFWYISSCCSKCFSCSFLKCCLLLWFLQVLPTTTPLPLTLLYWSTTQSLIHVVVNGLALRFQLTKWMKINILQQRSHWFKSTNRNYNPIQGFISEFRVHTIPLIMSYLSFFYSMYSAGLTCSYRKRECTLFSFPTSLNIVPLYAWLTDHSCLICALIQLGAVSVHQLERASASRPSECEL